MLPRLRTCKSPNSNNINHEIWGEKNTTILRYAFHFVTTGSCWVLTVVSLLLFNINFSWAYGLNNLNTSQTNDILSQNQEYANLSNRAYGTKQSTDDVFEGFSVIFPNDFPTSGFTATSYVKDGKIIVAFGGTTAGTNINKNDILQDANLLVGDKTRNIFGFTTSTSQLSDVDLYMSYITQYASEHGITNIEYTGHSLGGSLAQYASINFGGKAVTFNAGPVPLDKNVSKNVSYNRDITNIRTPDDPLSNFLFAAIDVENGTLTEQRVVFIKMFISNIIDNCNSITCMAGLGFSEVFDGQVFAKIMNMNSKDSADYLNKNNTIILGALKKFLGVADYISLANLVQGTNEFVSVSGGGHSMDFIVQKIKEISPPPTTGPLDPDTCITDSCVLVYDSSTDTNSGTKGDLGTTPPPPTPTPPPPVERTFMGFIAAPKHPQYAVDAKGQQVGGGIILGEQLAISNYELFATHASRPLDISINAASRGNYKYTDWGIWENSNPITYDHANTANKIAWLVGRATRPDEMPSTGSATYKGDVLGLTSNNEGIGGDVSLTANFETNSLNYLLELNRPDGSDWVDISANTNLITGYGLSGYTGQTYFNSSYQSATPPVITAPGTNSVVSGYADVVGTFYGPRAEEMGGTFHVYGLNGPDYGAAGVFRAKEQ
jgi:hypothetical protein